MTSRNIEPLESHSAGASRLIVQNPHADPGTDLYLFKKFNQ